MYCRNCGANLGDAPVACGRCGWVVPSQHAAAIPVATLVPERQYDIGQDSGMRLLLPVGRSGWAIAAGYAGLFAVLMFPAPLAVLFAILAINDIKKHPEKHGMGRAIFGLIIGVLGSIGLVAMIIGLLTSGHR